LKAFRHIFALFAAAGLLVGGEPQLHREGASWVQTTNGSEFLGEGSQLKIVCLGNVTVKGASREQATYSLTRRVRAGSEAQARDIFQEATVAFTRQGRLARLVVGDDAGPVDLQLTVPRNIRTVFVHTESGRVDISDIDGQASAESGAGKITVSRVKGGVEVRSAGGKVQMSQIGGSARVISAGDDIVADSIGGDATLETGGGNITVQKVGGGIHANTGGGTIRIGEAGGAVIANTMGGQIDIGQAGGTVSARNSGGGPIQIGSATTVRCENASGAIRVGSLNGAMRVSTASGSVIAQLLGDRLVGDSFVSTGSGDITVYVPSNLGVTVQAQNEGSGRTRSIVSDFPGLNIRSQGVTVTARGAINGGGPVLRIQCTGGMIWIKKK